MLFVPVPSSRVASLMIWASIASNVASAALNVAHRLELGESDWRAHALDAVTLASSFLGIAGGIMKRGANIELAGRGALGTSRAVCLYGQFTADSVSGVISQIETIDALIELRARSDLPPDKKFGEAVTRVMQAIASGVMTAVSLRYALRDLDLATRRNIHTEDDLTLSDFRDIIQSEDQTITLTFREVEGISADNLVVTASTGHRDIDAQPDIGFDSIRTQPNMRFGDMQVQEGARSELRAALSAVEAPPGAPELFQAHHIVLFADRRAQPARDVLNRFRIGLNEAVNGVWLENRQSAGRRTEEYRRAEEPRQGFGSGHHSPDVHTPAYIDAVNHIILRAARDGDMQSVLSALARIKENLKQGVPPQNLTP